MIVDTHCHLNFPETFPDPAAEIAYAKEMGVETLVVVGCDLESSQRALDLADRFSEIYAVVGIHPNYTATYAPSMLDSLGSMLRHPKAVALGEIGLDYHWDYATQAQQYDALRAQLALADQLDKPIVFHCREAYDDLLDILESDSPRPERMLLHCFSGDAADAERALAMGMYFGVDGPLTYKSAQPLRDLFLSLPRERVLIETDSPYMTPVPHRGKPNRPGYVRFVNNMLASLWRLNEEEAAAITTANARRFFRL